MTAPDAPDWFASYGLAGLEPPYAVRVAFYEGHVMPHVQIWGRVLGADGKPDVYPSYDFCRPQVPYEEWGTLLVGARFYTFVNPEVG